MIEVYADGSVRPANPGQGGWAYLIKHSDGTEEMGWGGCNKSTNNRMELMGVIQALLLLVGTDEQVVVYSDSQYVIKTITDGWERKKNRDLWCVLDALNTNKVKWNWVKGHNGNKPHDRVDKVANAIAGFKYAREEQQLTFRYVT